MGLLLAAAEAELTTKIRNRIADGAAVREVAREEIPAWFTAKVEDVEAVEAVFTSEFAAVAVLTNGQAIVGRAPRC